MLPQDEIYAIISQSDQMLNLLKNAIKGIRKQGKVPPITWIVAIQKIDKKFS